MVKLLIAIKNSIYFDNIQINELYRNAVSRSDIVFISKQLIVFNTYIVLIKQQRPGLLVEL